MRGVASAAGKAGVYGVNNGGGAGYGVFGSSNNVGVWGTGTNNVGVFGTSTNSNGVLGTVNNPNTVGVYATNNGGGYAIAAGGSASQTLASGGWVKAMALIDPTDGADPVKQCFNGQLPGPQATSGNCGITTERLACNYVQGVDFGFSVSDRFVQVTPFYNSNGEISATVSYGPGSNATANSVFVSTFYADEDEEVGSRTCAKFVIIVY